MTLKVVKIGGAALSDAAWLGEFAAAVAEARAPLVIVHGGGPDITALSARLGIEVRWHEGRRVTPPEAMDVAAMVLTGRVNKKIVGALLAGGVDAIGLSGIDGGLLRAEIVANGDLGRVGRVASVRTGLISALLHLGHSIVVSPVSIGPDGGAVNVNADDAAAAIAAAIGATELVFLTDVPGVRDGGAVRQLLAPAEAVSLIQAGVATGGMSIKLGAAVTALESGVTAVRIGDTTALFDLSAGTLVQPACAGLSLGVA